MMTKHEFKELELKRLGLKMRGIWWWSDELDNPFGEALLVCPHPERSTKRAAYANLYTVKEAENGLPSVLTAKDDKRMPYARIGWTIFEKGKATMWTLPTRFEYDNLMPEIEHRLALSAKGKRLARERSRKRNK